VPAEFSTEATQMLTSGAIVASVALPLGLLGWLSRSRSEGLLPSWKPWRVPWGGFEVLGSFVVVSFAIPLMVLSSRLVPPMAVGVVAFPIQLAFFVVTAVAMYPKWRPRVSLSGALPVAVLAWLLLTPTILLFHAGVVQVFTALDMKPDEHPLAKFGGESLLEQVWFLKHACIAAPLIEEILFRGILLTWVIGVRERGPGHVSAAVPAALRPWFVMGFALLFSATSGKVGPMVFAAILAAGLAVVWVTVRRGKRHIRSVYATAAMFAMVHSSVWPSPVPLFLLGLGLGWCAVRTRGVLVPAIVHGLFNAVSAVFVLRSGTG